MPSPRRAQRITAGIVLLLLLGSLLLPAVSALSVSGKAIRVVGSQRYPDNVQSYSGPLTGESSGFDGDDVGIAILDTGVDDGHPAFRNPIAFYAGAEAQAACQMGPDEDCMIDQHSDGTCYNPDDTHGHGTHVASIALGRGGDGRPRGIASAATLIDVKIASDVGGISADGLVKGINWVIDYNKGKTPCEPNPPVRVISISFDTKEPKNDQNYTRLMDAVRKAHQNDILVVAAAGNCGPGSGDVSLNCAKGGSDKNSITVPGATPEALTVGAVDDQDTVGRGNDEVAGYSSRGPNPAESKDDERWRKPDVVAPGTDIAAACAQTTPSTEPQTGSGMDCEKSGTSMATPHVAGLAAILFQAETYGGDEERPSATKIKDLITSTATDWGEDGWDKDTGYGYVNGYDAVVKAVNRAPRSEFTFSPTEPEVGEAVTFDASVTVDPDDDPIERFIWQISDGTGTIETSGDEVTLDHVFEDSITYTVELQAIDQHGSKDPTPYKRTVRVVEPEPEDTGERPKPIFTSHPKGPRVDTRVLFDANDTSDPDGHSIVKYQWDFDPDGSTFEPEKTLTRGWTHWSFAEPGLHEVVLRVQDETGAQDTYRGTVSVNPALPDRPQVNITNPQEGDEVQAGKVLASWGVQNPTNNFTVVLDGTKEAQLVERQIRLDISEGEHTLRVIAQGPGGKGIAWSNFTAIEDESLTATSNCENGTTDDGECATDDGTGEGPGGAEQAASVPDPSQSNESPGPAVLALLAALAVGALVRRRL